MSSRDRDLTPERRALLEARLRGEAGGEPAPGVTPRSRDRAALPLTCGQRGLWFLSQLAPGSPEYNVPTLLRLCGDLDRPALEVALAQVVARHEALRTRFAIEGGRPVQLVEPEAAVAVAFHDLRDVADASEAERRASELVRTEAGRPFDLACAPLLRALLVRVRPAEHLLVVNVHHIVFDGWSGQILARELGELYGAASAGRPPALADPPIQFGDYAVWEEARVPALTLERQLAHWRRQLGGLAPLGLPSDRPRPAARSGRGGQIGFAIPPGVLTALDGIAAARGATLFMALVTAFQIVLARHSGQDDVAVGVPVARRGRHELEDVIGYFLNLIVLRADLSGDPTFGEAVTRARETALSAFANQDVPFEQLVEKLQPAREPGRTPFVQAMFELGQGMEEDWRLPGLEVEHGPVFNETAKFDVSLSIAMDGAGGAVASLGFATDVCDADTAARLANGFQVLLRCAAAGPDRSLSRLDLLADDDRRQLERWNDTRRAYDLEPRVHELIEERARLTPDATAVVSGDVCLTYGELDSRAAGVAGELRAAGVAPEAVVGICMERSAGQVVALLGTWKAGAAYLPLDPAYPEQRLRFMVEDTRPAAVLTEPGLRDLLDGTATPTLCPAAWPAAGERPRLSSGRQGTGDSLAYVIYTSGSTGRPKGVQIPHRALLNFLRSAGEEPGLGPDDVLLAVTTLSFDIAGLDLYLPLLVGARVVVAPARAAADGVSLRRLLASSGATHLQATPATWRLLVESGWQGDRRLVAISGGEALPPDLAAELERRCGQLWNIYGPTETTIWSTRERVDVERGVTIGRALANTRLHVLDRWLRPVPPGVPGELLIGGAGVGRGYRNQPGLTAGRFLPDPSGGGDRLYRTGDLVRFRSDGRLEYLGRLDHQVKVRGFRIEPGEIEAALVRHDAVARAVVVAREDRPGDGRLVGYLVPRGGARPDAADLRAHLRRDLPDHMVPGAFVWLEALPMTPNGKLDRGALPAPGARAAAGAERSPRTPVERVLARVWAEVLGLERVSVEDSFFALGGHSLLAVQALSRIRERLGLEVSLQLLFDAPTVAGLAAALAGAEPLAELPMTPPAPGDAVPLQLLFNAPAVAVPAGPLTPPARGEGAPLSFAQRRLWVLQALQPDSAEYNVSVGLRLRGPLVRDALERALGEIVRRHEVLRSTFPLLAQEPAQVVHPPAPLAVAWSDLGSLPADEAERRAAALAAAEAGRAFDLARDWPLRPHLVRLSMEEHLLLLEVHHIAFDGWSARVLTSELDELYGAFRDGVRPRLPELPIQYGDFAAWQRRWLDDDRQRELLAYWREELRGLAALELPTDHVRPGVRTGRGGQVGFELERELVEELRGLGREAGGTLFMALLSGLGVLLWRYSGQGDVAVGTPVGSRSRVEVEGLIGVFMNLLVLRLEVSGRSSGRELLREVRTRALGAYEHQEVPFERLVEELGAERDPSRTPLFQVLLQLDEGWEVAGELSGLEVSGYEVEEVGAKYDLSLVLMERGDGGLAGRVVYSRDLFEEGTVERLAGHYVRLLRGLAREPERGVGELELLSEWERRQVLEEWNLTDAEYPEERCLHELFEAQVERSPEACAVVCGEGRLSYRELNERANQVAHELRRRGVGAETVVGLLVGRRSGGLLVGLLGILKAGGCYLPLDPEHPWERQRFMLEETGARVVVTEAEQGGRLAGWLEAVSLDGNRELLSGLPTANPEPVSGPRNLVYVIYTSGSTGRPKGVMVEHRGLTNYLWWCREGYGLWGSRGAPMVGSIAYDLVLPNLLLPLLGGLEVRFLGAGGELEELCGLLREEGDYSLLKITPGHLDVLRTLLPEGSRLRAVRTYVVGADEVRAETVRAWKELAPGARVINEYGPTETVVGCSVYEVRGDEDVRRSVSIGRPIANTRMYVLDEHLRPVPLGVGGELYIGGEGVARGYLGRADVSAERFLPSPYGREAGERFYRTGDLARWRVDGNLEFLGRHDQQVKIRGYRVELGEIEAQLARHPRVSAAVVAVGEEVGGGKRLVAYVVCDGEAPGVGELREHLSRELPEHMVPGSYVYLDRLPLSGAGKVDRRLLPEPGVERPELGSGYRAPRNQVEAALCEIWAGVLGVERVGIHDDFFELGGNSVGLIRASTLARRAGLPAEPRDLYENQSVAQLALALANRTSAGPPVARTHEGFTALVRIRPEGSRRPLFCVHPSGGGVAWYVALCPALDPAQPLVAFQPVGMDGDREPLGSVEDMAERYVAEMRAYQGSPGPYALLGWSLGGTIAFEMARQLEALGEVAGPLLLVEPSLPADAAAAEENRQVIELYARATELVESVNAAAEGTAERRRREARLTAFLKEVGWPRSEIQLGSTLPMRASWRMLEAYERYEAGPYGGSIQLIVSEECVRAGEQRRSTVAHASFDDYLRRWRRLVAGPVTVHHVGRVHQTMFSGEHAGELARLCSRLIV
jgi:amino acid adenylation domain-containing protein